MSVVAGDSYPVFDLDRVRFGINICYDTQFPRAAAAVAAHDARVLLVPAQNMMRRDKAEWWQHRHHEIRARRARETGMWLVSADVTGERDQSRIGLGPTSVLDPTGAVLVRVPTGTTGMAVLDTAPHLPVPPGHPNGRIRRPTGLRSASSAYAPRGMDAPELRPHREEQC